MSYVCFSFLSKWLNNLNRQHDLVNMFGLLNSKHKILKNDEGEKSGCKHQELISDILIESDFRRL